MEWDTQQGRYPFKERDKEGILNGTPSKVGGLLNEWVGQVSMGKPGRDSLEARSRQCANQEGIHSKGFSRGQVSSMRNSGRPRAD